MDQLRIPHSYEISALRNYVISSIEKNTHLRVTVALTIVQ